MTNQNQISRMKCSIWGFVALIGLAFIFILFDQLHLRSTLQLTHLYSLVQLNGEQLKYLSEEETMMANRVTTLEGRCKLYEKNISKIALPYLAKRYALVRRHKLLFCSVHKTGTSLWHNIIARLANLNDLFDRKMVQKAPHFLRPTIPELKQILRKPSDWSRLVFTRDPLFRVLSAYFDRIADTNHSRASWQALKHIPLILKLSRKKMYRKSSIFDANKTAKIIPTFKEFVFYLTKQKVTKMDDHWKPITDQCFLCSFPFDYVINTETISGDLSLVFKETGLDKLIDRKLYTRVVHKGSKNTSELFEEKYKSCGAGLVFELLKVYKWDFILLGYDPIPSLRKIFPNTTIPSILS